MGPGMVPISLKMMLSMPKANDLWMGSTDLRVATTLGMADIKVNQMETKMEMSNPGRYGQC